MSFQYLKLCFFLSCVLVWHTSSGQQLPAAQEPASESQTIANAFYDVLLGEIVTQNGAPSLGYELILNGARASGDERLFKRATDIALRTRNGNNALGAAQAWTTAYPESYEANRYLWQILVLLNRPIDSMQALEKTLQYAETNTKLSIITSIPKVYKNSQKDISTPLKITLTKELENKNSAAAWTSLGEIYLQNEKISEAINALKNANLANNNYIELYYLAANLMLKNSTEAEEILSKKLSLDPTAEIRSLYIKALLAKNNIDLALAESIKFTEKNPKIDEAWFLLAKIQIQKNQLNQATATLNQFIKINIDSIDNNADLYQAYLLQSEIALKVGNFIDAQDWINKIPNNSQYFSVVNQQARIFIKQGKLEVARGLLRTFTPTKSVNTSEILKAEVSLLKEFKYFKEAVETQEALVKLTPNDEENLYALALLVEKNGDFPKMEDTLRLIIKKFPNFHHAYNALGYSFADKGIRLQEAKKLILKALEIAPNDPFIIDSLGWVEFRLGNKSAALKLLEKAYKLQADPEIVAHLIHAYRSLNESSKADILLNQALEKFPSSEPLIKLKNNQK